MALCLWVAAPLPAEERRADEPGTVILLSLDGTRYDYPERAETPAFDRMERDGVRAGRLTPVFPTNTFPNHVSLATGAHPDRHGIVANSFHDSERGRFHYSNDASWIEAEPVWIAAERQGLRAATFFWVGSETDWNGTGATYRRAPFDSGVPESEKVDQIVSWLDLPAAERPRLIASWWHGCDGVGHDKGPAHSSIATQLRAQDHELGRLLSELDTRDAWSHTTLILVSDHGMAEVARTIDVLSPLKEAGISAKLIRGGGTGFLWLDAPTQRSDALAVLGNMSGLRAFPSDALPPELRAYHPKRSGHITLIADPQGTFYAPTVMQSSLLWFGRLFGAKRGMHGYEPDVPEMGAVFYALGRGVPADLELDTVRAIDVAPTVTSLLGIDPPKDAEGKRIGGIGP